MTGLYLITGFLGAGKSTFLKEFIRQFPGEKIQLIINEFGRESIDGILLAEGDIGIREITGGSVFCACRLDQFENALQTFVEPDTEAVIVEASGLSDPSGVQRLLCDAERFGHLQYEGSICLIDALHFPKTCAKARACIRQLAAADIALINKTDIVSLEQRRIVRDLVMGLRPDLRICEAAFGKTETDLRKELKSIRETAGEREKLLLTEDLTIRSLSVRVKEGIRVPDLEGFLKLFVEMTFRVKGFIRTDQGVCLVSCVGNRIQITRYQEEVPPERCGVLVILSGGGMPVRKSVKEAVAWYDDVCQILP